MAFPFLAGLNYKENLFAANYMDFREFDFEIRG